MDNQQEDPQGGTKRGDQKCILFGCMLRAFHQRLGYDWGGKDSSQEGVEGDNTHWHRHSAQPFTSTLVHTHTVEYHPYLKSGKESCLYECRKDITH